MVDDEGAVAGWMDHDVAGIEGSGEAGVGHRGVAGLVEGEGAEGTVLEGDEADLTVGGERDLAAAGGPIAEIEERARRGELAAGAQGEHLEARGGAACRGEGVRDHRVADAIRVCRCACAAGVGHARARVRVDGRVRRGVRRRGVGGVCVGRRAVGRAAVGSGIDREAAAIVAASGEDEGQAGESAKHHRARDSAG